MKKTSWKKLTALFAAGLAAAALTGCDDDFWGWDDLLDDTATESKPVIYL